MLSSSGSWVGLRLGGGSHKTVSWQKCYGKDSNLPLTGVRGLCGFFVFLLTIQGPKWECLNNSA